MSTTDSYETRLLNNAIPSFGSGPWTDNTIYPSQVNWMPMRSVVDYIEAYQCEYCGASFEGDYCQRCSSPRYKEPNASI